MKSLPKISSLVVAYNEEVLIESIIASLRDQDYHGETEIILADGGSKDRTVELAQQLNIKVIKSPSKGKSIQMNTAAKEASGDILFFVHADMSFPETLFNSIADSINQGASGGGFANEFDEKNSTIKRLGSILNLRLFDQREQSDKGIFYGDNGIFVLKKVFDQLGGFKEIPIMEDYDFSKRLNKEFKTYKIKNPKIIVSARRHIKSGFLKTRLQWIFIKKLFLLGVSPHLLAKWYSDVR